MSAPLILPQVLPDATLTGELDEFFEGLGVLRSSRTTYASIMYVLGQNLGRRRMGTSLIGTFRNTDRVEYHSTKHVTYGAFNVSRAREAQKRTLLERSAVIGRLQDRSAKFVATDVGRSPAHETFKACLALPEGLMPFTLASTSHRNDPVDELLEDLVQLGIDLPLVSVRSDGPGVDRLLAAATRRRFDHFAVVHPLWRPQKDSGIVLGWAEPATTDSLGVGDSLARVRQADDGLGPATAGLTVEHATARAAYLAHGPSPLNRYYLQRILPHQGQDHALRVLQARARAVEECAMSLTDWPVEQLVMRTSSHPSWQRMRHAIGMSSLLTLHAGFAAAASDDPAAWARLYDAWGAPLENTKWSSQ
jgi:hypothetical protein